MKAILNRISRFAANFRKLFRKPKAAPVMDEHTEMLKTISKAENAIYKSIKIQIANDPDLPAYGTDARLLKRRMAQYERMRSHASLADQDKALQKLEKQFKKLQSRSYRTIHKDHSEIRRAPDGGPSRGTDGLP